MAFAYASFNQGTHHLSIAAKMEAEDINQAAAMLREAIDDFRRFAKAFKHTKEALNNLGLSYAKLGIYALAKRNSSNALFAWQTEFSIEPELAMKFQPLKKKEARRSADVRKAETVPLEFRRAENFFKKALKVDEGYARARYNYAAVLLALGQYKNAEHQLARVKADCRDSCALKATAIDTLLAITRAELGQLEQAVTHFAASGAATSANVYNPGALERSGDSAGAKAAYARFIQRTKTSKAKSIYVQRAEKALKRLE